MDAVVGVDRRWPRAWPWLLVAFACVVLSPFSSEMARRSAGPGAAWWVGAQILTTAAAWLIPQLQQIRTAQRQARAERREEDARAEMAVRMNDALDPIVRVLGRLSAESGADERSQLRAQMVPLVLKTAAELIGPERARACFFVLEAGPPKRLVPTDFAGRAGPPSTVFEEGTPAGDAAIEMVLADQERLCEDTRVEPPPGWDASRERDYRTFVSVSVIAGDTAYGMLTLDAMEPGELTRDDMQVLRLMAGALAVALGIG